MTAPVDVLAPPSFAAREHANFMVTAGANRREKNIHDATFGHYGVTVATVSFEHEYARMPDYGAKMATDYAYRLVACADAMKGVADPRAFVAAVAELIEADKALDRACYALSQCDPNEDPEAFEAERGRVVECNARRAAALARVGGAK